MGKTIYYYELSLAIDFARGSELLNTWYVCKIKPEDLNWSVKNNRELLAKIVFTAKGKRAAALLKRGIKKVDVKINSWKDVGQSQT